MQSCSWCVRKEGIGGRIEGGEGREVSLVPRPSRRLGPGNEARREVYYG